MPKSVSPFAEKLDWRQLESRFVLMQRTSKSRMTAKDNCASPNV